MPAVSTRELGRARHPCCHHRRHLCGGDGADDATPRARCSSTFQSPWLMYFVFAASVAIIIGAFVQRVRIWRLGQAAQRHRRPRRARHEGADDGRRHEPREERPLRRRHALAASTRSFVVLTLVTTPPGARRLPADHLRLGRTSTPSSRARCTSATASSATSSALIGLRRRRDGRLPPLRVARRTKLTWDRRGAEDAIIVGAARVRALHRHPRRGPAHRRRRNPGRQRRLVEVVARGLDVVAKIVRHAREHAERCSTRTSWWWWFHVVAAFGLLTLMALTKFRHIVFAPVNALLQAPGARQALPRADGRLSRELIESGAGLGAGQLQDFTWKQLFELDACVRCGRCTDGLPRRTSPASRSRRWPSSRT